MKRDFVQKIVNLLLRIVRLLTVEADTYSYCMSTWWSQNCIDFRKFKATVCDKINAKIFHQLYFYLLEAVYGYVAEH